MGTRQNRRSRGLGRPLTGARRHGRRAGTAALAFLMLATGTALSGGAAASAASTGQRVDLRVLVVSDGNPMEEAIVSELDSESVPYTRIDLNSASRPTITACRTSRAPPRPARRRTSRPSCCRTTARPSSSADEKTALVNFETTFGIRQVDSYTWPTAAVGLNTVTGSGATGGFAGSLDGTHCQDHAAPRSRARSPTSRVRSRSTTSTRPSASRSATSAIPLANTATRTFTTLLDAPVPGSTRRGSLLGVVKNGTREELVSTMAINQFQSQFQVIAHGIITWMTKGVHLGYDRNYFTVQVDDAFLADSRWSTQFNCTPGDGCPPGSTVTTPDIRMTPTDVAAAVQWMQQTGFRLDFAYNGCGSDEWAAAHRGQDTLKTALQLAKTQFNWINHTYYARVARVCPGLQRVPWQCTTTAGVTAVGPAGRHPEPDHARTSPGPRRTACRSTRRSWSPASTPASRRCRSSRPTTRTSRPR